MAANSCWDRAHLHHKDMLALAAKEEANNAVTFLSKQQSEQVHQSVCRWACVCRWVVGGRGLLGNLLISC